MLQTAKNLAKFISAVKPNADAFISAGIRNDGEAEAFIYLHKGNGREIFAKLITCPTLELSQMESTSDKYIDLKGMYDGYKLRVTFLNERDTDDLVTLERHDPKAGYPEVVKCSYYWNYMTPEEWNMFMQDFYAIRKNAGDFGAFKSYLERCESNNLSFAHLVGGAFFYDNTDNKKAYREIEKRTEPIV